MPRIPCPSCAKAVRVTDEQAGRKLKCPHCRCRLPAAPAPVPPAPPSVVYVIPPRPGRQANGFGVAGMVLSILGLLLVCVPVAGAALGGLGLFLGVVGYDLSRDTFSAAAAAIGALALLPTAALTAVYLIGLAHMTGP